MTSSLAETRVLFVATAGAAEASAHFVQYLLVARMLGVRPLIAVPGPQHVAEIGVALGADVIAGAAPRVIDAMQPDLVVVADPVAAQVGGWIIAAQRAGALVVTLHELGISALQINRKKPARAKKVRPVLTARQTTAVGNELR